MPQTFCPNDFRSFSKVIWRGNWANLDIFALRSPSSGRPPPTPRPARPTDPKLANEEEAGIMIRLLITRGNSGRPPPRNEARKRARASDWQNSVRRYVNNGDQPMYVLPPSFSFSVLLFAGVGLCLAFEKTDLLLVPPGN